MLKSSTLLLLLGSFVPTRGSCNDGEDTCTVPINTDAAAQSKNTDDVSEMHVELLQRDIRLTDQKKLQHLQVDPSSTVTVKTWKCLDSTGKNTSKAYQSTTAAGNVATKFNELNMETGQYIETMNIDLNLIPLATPPSSQEWIIRSMNSCAINPQDSILYCSLELNQYNNNNWRGSFLVRIDQDNTIGFVTKLQGFRYAATFDNEDNYYISGQNKMTILKNVSTLPAYAGFQAFENPPAQAQGYLGEQTVKLSIDGEPTTNYQLGEDFGILDLPLEGASKKPYLVSLRDTTLMVVSISASEPYPLYTIATDLPDLSGQGQESVWGAAWKWGDENSIYFAQDAGEGLWRLVSNTVAIGQTAHVKKVALANPATDWNDGFSCGDGGGIRPKPDPFPCKHELYQSITIPPNAPDPYDQESYIRHMTKAGTGQFELSFQVVPEPYGDEFRSMNACAVNPVDSILYCQLEMKDGSRIARVDSSAVGFVQQAPSWCFSAIFDAGGTMWLYSNNGLFSIPDLNTKEAWYSYKIYEVANDKTWKQYPGFNVEASAKYGAEIKGLIGADLALYQNKYLVSIVEAPGNNVSVIDISTGEPLMEVTNGSPYFEAVGLPGPLPTNTTNTWGSAWQTASGRILFARDYEGDLYELVSVDMAKKTATFNATGQSQIAYWHDGFSCSGQIKGIDPR